MCSVKQSCLILCDPMNCSTPGFFVQAVSQACVLEWVVISYSRGSSQSCTGRPIYYHHATWETPVVNRVKTNSGMEKTNKQPTGMERGKEQGL